MVVSMYKVGFSISDCHDPLKMPRMSRSPRGRFTQPRAMTFSSAQLRVLCGSALGSSKQNRRRVARQAVAAGVDGDYLEHPDYPVSAGSITTAA
jgi:hypothetical protein